MLVSGENDAMIGAAGADEMTGSMALETALTLPARSVALAVKTWVPPARTRRAVEHVDEAARFGGACQRDLIGGEHGVPGKHRRRRGRRIEREGQRGGAGTAGRIGLARYHRMSAVSQDRGERPRSARISDRRSERDGPLLKRYDRAGEARPGQRVV
jgi:hypothetical protein